MTDLDVRDLPNDDAARVKCPRCGTFEITGMAWNVFENHLSRDLDGNRYLLSARTRLATLDGQVIRLDLRDFGQAERREIPEPSIDEKVLLVLRWFEIKSSGNHGRWVTTESSIDYPAAYCHDGSEWEALVGDAVKEKWLDNEGLNFRINLAGRRRLAETRAVANKQPKEADVSQIPPWYSYLQSDVSRFNEDGPFEKSVFVMMKFPDPRMTPEVIRMLEDAHRIIREELDRYGLRARRADERTFAPSRQVWDNLCIYMLGCKYGLALLEDRSGEELNPNLTLEFGFMRALGRDAILIKDRAFKHIRADIVGTIPKDFSISHEFIVDEQSLREAVGHWMIDLGRPALRPPAPLSPRAPAPTPVPPPAAGPGPNVNATPRSSRSPLR